MTRRLVGTFSPGERHMHQWFDDAIGLTGDWRERGPVYAVPMRACVLTGEAAGTAAAMAVHQTQADARNLSFALLQNQLEKRNGLLHPDLVLPANDGTDGLLQTL